MVATAAELTDTMAADALAHVVHGYHRFRRYAPRMLRALDIHCAPVAEALIKATKIIADDKTGGRREVTFLRRTSKWHRHLNAQEISDNRLWEVAVLFQVRDAFRSGDIWLPNSRRYADIKQALVPIETAKASPRLTMPFDPETWLTGRKTRLQEGLEKLAIAVRSGTIPGGSIENGVLKVDRLTGTVPDEADAMVLDLYSRLPPVRITDLIQEVDDDIGFTEAFTHLRTGVPCKDRIGLLMNETGRKIKEQYADTGGFTDHVFAVTALLSYRFIPRIRDLPSKRLYLFAPGAARADRR